MQRWLPLLALATLAFAGCSSPSEDPGATAGDTISPPLPPLELPQLAIDRVLLTGGPIMGAGEAAGAVAPDGTRYVAVTGCGDLPSLTGIEAVDQRCWHSPVYRSDDGGATWVLLNQGADGRLDPDAPYANGDADVAVDAAGTVYVTNLVSGGVDVQRSTDRGATWTRLADLAQDSGADRPWVVAGQAGHVVVTWHEGGVAQVRFSRDAGATWSETQAAPSDASQLGAPILRQDCWCIAIPLVMQDADLSGPSAIAFGIEVAFHDLDDGTWDVADTGARLYSSATGFHTGGTLVFPSLARASDGTWAAAWSEEENDEAGATALASRMKVITSRDGRAWSAPRDVTPGTSAVMPWLAGGPDGRFLLASYASDLPLDSDYVGRWDVHLQAFDATGGDVLDAVVARDVHQGGICTRGTLCPAFASDRSLLDNLDVVASADGSVFVVYGADPAAGARRISIHAASGTWVPWPLPAA